VAEKIDITMHEMILNYEKEIKFEAVRYFLMTAEQALVLPKKKFVFWNL
jgi:hypothetical protein